ncbi:MAG TPA: ABC transporter ATP-binding protein [Actinomycetota bacterium]|nr:ABC transporter ATP-binding protein [Actinomycetota bacterium]
MEVSDSHPPLAVEVHDLVRVFESAKRFRKPASQTTALDGITLSIPLGEVHGLLGPNGAGKTTLVKILSTVLLPTSGTAEVLGINVASEAREVRPLIGLVFGGERGLYPRITGRQNLRYWAALYRMPKVDAKRRTDVLLERVGLAERADDRVETYSRGMKQRLHLARGLIGDPKVLFLDEPTTGMDPLAALDFRALVRELNREGRTILLTTHDMAEAESVCERVTLIDRGRVIATESPRTLARWISRFERVDVQGADHQILSEIELLPGVSKVLRDGSGTARIETSSDDATAEVMKRLVESGVTSVRTSLPSLEEVYVRLIGDRGLVL